MARSNKLSKKDKINLREARKKAEEKRNKQQGSSSLPKINPQDQTWLNLRGNLAAVYHEPQNQGEVDELVILPIFKVQKNYIDLEDLTILLNSGDYVSDLVTMLKGAISSDGTISNFDYQRIVSQNEVGENIVEPGEYQLTDRLTRIRKSDNTNKIPNGTTLRIHPSAYWLIRECFGEEGKERYEANKPKPIVVFRTNFGERGENFYCFYVQRENAPLFNNVDWPGYGNAHGETSIQIGDAIVDVFTWWSTARDPRAVIELLKDYNLAPKDVNTDNDDAVNLKWDVFSLNRYSSQTVQDFVKPKLGIR